MENAPVSEATRGVVAVLDAFGLPTSSPDLREAREFFASRKLESHIEQVFEMAGMSEAVMTNDPLDPDEAPYWEKGTTASHVHPVLRLDRILNRWEQHWQELSVPGLQGGADGVAVRRSRSAVFLRRGVSGCAPCTWRVSLPDTFQFPEDTMRGSANCAMRFCPSCEEFDIPLSLMIGVRYQVNPAIGLAGDACGEGRSARVNIFAASSRTIAFW